MKKTSKAKQDEPRKTWNKGLEVGPREPFTKAEVQRIRTMLVKRKERGLRDLALFSTGIDTMLHASDLLNLLVSDLIDIHGVARDTIEVTMRPSGNVVSCTLSKKTRAVLADWLGCTGKMKSDFVFTGRTKSGVPITPRQLSRLVKAWAQSVGITPTCYGTESLRRTRAAHIMRSTGDLESLRVLLGHTKIASTVRYLGDVQSRNPLDVSRACEL